MAGSLVRCPISLARFVSPVRLFSARFVSVRNSGLNKTRERAGDKHTVGVILRSFTTDAMDQIIDRSGGRVVCLPSRHVSERGVKFSVFALSSHSCRRAVWRGRMPHYEAQ